MHTGYQRILSTKSLILEKGQELFKSVAAGIFPDMHQSVLNKGIKYFNS